NFGRTWSVTSIIFAIKRIPMNKSGLSVISLILFILAFAGAWFYVKPEWETVSAMQQTRDSLREERDSTNAQLVQLQQLQQELSTASEVSQETSLAAIPETFNQDELLRELSALALSEDMVLNSLNFSIPEVSGGAEIASAQLNLNVTGSQSNLIDFLRAIETSSRKMLVRSITVQLGESVLGGRVNFNLSVETYFQGAI
ncbi:MAG TPA: type 4a pilus biogenesis protein PilO, partial [Candidatus Gracilibacteria bacterium]|nr:type 4a pilus biogenesis protein PilO [Candidatus Gracilibacteria bacterium]